MGVSRKGIGLIGNTIIKHEILATLFSDKRIWFMFALLTYIRP